MDNHFLKVTDEALLEDLVARSGKEPVIIFKHSTTCSISASAYQEMKKVNGAVNLIEVQSAPEVSREIEKRTGLRHESPQVIVLRNGKPVWNASHWRINADAVESAVRDNA
jgi:bacillithiol system protein YtxJ